MAKERAGNDGLANWMEGMGWGEFTTADGTKKRKEREGDFMNNSWIKKKRFEWRLTTEECTEMAATQLDSCFNLKLKIRSENKKDNSFKVKTKYYQK